jgi:subtilase family serine protease
MDPYLDNNYYFSYLAIIEPNIDYEISGLSSRDTVILSDRQVYLSFDVLNNGFSKSMGTNYKIYASEDSTFDPLADDVVYSGLLNVDAQKTAKFEYIPVQNLDYYSNSVHLFTVLDPDNEITEVDETNNRDSLRLTLLPSGEDYTISNITLNQDSVLAGHQISGNFRLNNLGNRSFSDRVNVGIYLSADSVLDEGDRFLKAENASSVYGGSYVYEYFYVSTDPSLESGDYYLLFKADYENEIDELRETNNLGKSIIKVTETVVDIAIDSMSMNSYEAVPGHYLLFTTHAKNYGNRTSNNNLIKVYLSVDDDFNKIEDAYLGEEYIGYLSPSGMRTKTISVEIPEGFDTGSYVVFVELEPNDDINESNNIAQMSITLTEPRMDGAISFKDDSIVMYKGDYQSVYVTLTNYGNVGSNEFSIEYYLSEDTLLSQGDSLLRDYHHYNLPEPGTSKYISNSIQLGTNYEEGNYFLIIKLLVNGISEDINLSNNVAYQKVRVYNSGYDFRVEPTITYDNVLDPYQQMELACNVYNDGNRSQSTEVHYFLSHDSIYDTNDNYLGNDYTYSLSDGSWSYEGMSYYLGGNYFGNYYVLYVVDRFNEISELNENNNIAAVHVTIDSANYNEQNDYKIHKAYTYSNSHSSILDSLILSYSLRRNVEVDSGDVTFVEIYMVYDSINYNYSDLIALDSITNWSGKRFYRQFNILVEKDSLKPYLMLKILNDDLNISNNTKIVRIENRSAPVYYNDLTLNYFNLIQDKTTPGGLCTSEFAIKNKGTYEMLSPGVGFFLSSDTIFDNSDINLSNYSFSKLNPGDSLYGTRSFIIPELIDSGRYYVIAYGDYQNKLFERNEENNISFSELHIKEDLNIGVGINITIHNQIIHSDSNINFSGVISNPGEVHFNNVSFNVYLSFDSVMDNYDILLDTLNLRLIEVNDSLDLYDSIPLPFNTPAGNYYIIFSLADNRQEEPLPGESTKVVAVTVGNTLDILPNESEQPMVLYPIPAQNRVYIKSNKKLNQAQLYDMKGNLVKVYNFHHGDMSMDIHFLPKGEYIVKLLHLTENTIIIKRIIKE